MFWNNFVELCEANNIKPNPLGKILGVSSAALTKWKNGVVPGAEILIKIADYFNVSVDYLLGRAEDINGSKNIDSVITHGSDNIINNHSNNNTQSNPIENSDVWNAYLMLGTKDKLEIQLEILKRANT